MKSKWFAARSSAVLVLVTGLLGAAAPSSAYAGSLGQEGAEAWGSFTISAPDRGQLAVRPDPPRLSMQQQAIIEQAPLFSHLPGPRTPMDPNATILEGPPALGPTEPASEITALSPGTFTIFSDETLSGATGIDATGQAVSPSAANNGRTVLTTYNYHAALSTDYGATWGYIDPTDVSAGAEGVHGGFAGDQDVLYAPSRDLMVWTLRYIPNATGNQLRLVVLDGSSELEGAPVDYLAVSLTPEGKCTGTDNADWFDVPQLALTNNFLYVSANVFRFPTNAFTCSIVMRIPLQNLDAGPFYDTTNNLFFSTEDRSLTGAHGGTHSFYFAAHVDNNTLRIYDWPESALPAAVTSTDIDHASYLTGIVHNCTVTGTAVNPCAADDDRITDGWLRRDLNELGFMWDVPQGTDGNGTFSYPYVRALVVDATTKALVSDDYVHSTDGAFFLPSAAVNARGHVGGTYAFAGDVIGAGTGAYYPQCNAWLYDDVTSETLGNWSLADNLGVTSGTGNPTGNRWGDYLRTRMSGLNPFQWIGTCYAMEGGAPVPHVVRFGRERDTFSRMKVDFDVDGRTDPTVFEPATGNWFTVGSGAGFFAPALNFGSGPSYTLVPGDYDGDGKVEPAVFEEATGNWFVVGSHDGFYTPALNFGDTSFVPVPGDYDGDGRTDPAVFQAATGNWFAVGSTSGFFVPGLNFGGTDYIPLPADYDGDGSTDIAVMEKATGNWFVLGSTDGFYSPALGFGDGTNYIPVPADYDGDGLADPAVYHIATGNWFVMGSTSGFYVPALNFGSSAFTPEPADYDGDGKADPAVYEKATGNWFVVGSRDGFFSPALNFGNTNFIAVISQPR